MVPEPCAGSVPMCSTRYSGKRVTRDPDSPGTGGVPAMVGAAEGTTCRLGPGPEAEDFRFTASGGIIRGHLCHRDAPDLTLGLPPGFEGVQWVGTELTRKRIGPFGDLAFDLKQLVVRKLVEFHLRFEFPRKIIRSRVVGYREKTGFSR
jgi:hypothetical protein